MNESIAAFKHLVTLHLMFSLILENSFSYVYARQFLCDLYLVRDFFQFQHWLRRSLVILWRYSLELISLIDRTRRFDKKQLRWTNHIFWNCNSCGGSIRALFRGICCTRRTSGNHASDGVSFSWKPSTQSYRPASTINVSLGGWILISNNNHVRHHCHDHY